MIRYRLRTLLILMAVGPIVLVAIYAVCAELYILWLEDHDFEAFKKLPP